MVTTATGTQGAVTFGLVPAAHLRAWRLDPVDDAPMTWTLTGTAVNVNTFYMTQTPLSVSLRVGSRNWRWHDVVLEIAGGTVRGTVTGRPEVR
jgi:hypothetical protein